MELGKICTPLISVSDLFMLSDIPLCVAFLVDLTSMRFFLVDMVHMSEV